MTPEAPFLKAITFTLMGLPKVQAGCVPLLDAGINILNLPLISNFVNYAIGRSDFRCAGSSAQYSQAPPLT